MGDITLTSEQKQFLAECEEEFKDRYTENDISFMEIKKQVPMKPPIVDPWYNKPRRPYDWTRQNQNQNQNQNRRNHHWDRRNNERNERWDRHAGKHHMHYRQRMY